MSRTLLCILVRCSVIFFALLYVCCDAEASVIGAPQREDICYATSNRQWAVKELLPEVDLLLVIGSRNSSNSNRLVEICACKRRCVVPDRRRD